MRYLAIGSLLVLLFFSACQSDTAEQQALNVQVEDVKYTLLPGGARIVTGTLFNPSEDPVKGAQIQISLFDRNNIKVSSMNITVKDVPPGERKPFRQPIDTDLDIQGAKVRSVLVL
ncbi:MAG: FxLYD domain-containing protein [Rhodothermales bacterium]